MDYFFIFIITIFILYLFFATLRRYITDTTFLLDELFNDMGQLLTPQTQNQKADKKFLKLKQREFVDALEATGDILAFETKNKKGEEKIKKGLDRIREKMGQFLEMQKSRPEEFERLLLSQDFFDIYEKDQTNAQLLLRFNTEKHLVSFTAAVNQLLRIREAALEVNNSEIGLFATYHIIWLLKDISQIPNNPLLVEQLLKNLAEIRRNTNQNQSALAHLVSISWYFTIVFDDLFDISYLELFDRYFFNSIKRIISQGETSLFQGMVSTLIDSGNIRISENFENYIYEELYNSNPDNNIELHQENLETKIQSVERLIPQVRAKLELNNCLNSIDEIEKLIQPYIDASQQEKYDKIRKTKQQYIKHIFKFNNLKDIIFGVGAYCIFKDRFDYIKYLWKYKQPSDSDAFWIGHDIVPSGLSYLINFYFGFDFGASINSKKTSLIWEEHHGSSLYYKQYFLLFLLQEFQRNDPQKLIEEFRLSNIVDSRILNDICFSVDKLKEVSHTIKENTENLKIMEFNMDTITDDIEAVLIPFLERLKPQAEEQLKTLLKNKKISITKIENFKKEFIEKFNQSTVIRKIFNEFSLYEDKSYEYFDEQINLSFVTEGEKTAFFDEWYSTSINYGSTYGGMFGKKEDCRILDEIANLCQEIDNIQLDTTIELFRKNLDDVFIIAINSAHRFIKNTGKFNAKWQKDYPQMKVRGFEGCYKFGDCDIPVFRVHDNTINEIILILDKSRLGKLVQYSPNSGIKREELTGIFNIGVQSFSENQELMNDLLQNPPDWLTDLGDQVQQKDYLEQKVQIEISQTFQFEKHQDFQGYLIKVPNQDSSNLDNFIS